MSGRSIVIVGGGIAGLSSGCYAQMNGYNATVVEMHKIPGGLCTAWKRKGYTFDISMHMVVGSKNGPLNLMWRELGALQKREFHYHTEVLRIESGDRSFRYTSDPVDIERQMLAISPADAKRIRQFVSLISGRDAMRALLLTPDELQNSLDKAKMMLPILPLMPTFARYGSQTIQDFADGFRDAFLRRVVRFYIDTPGWPMVQFPLVALAGALKTTARDAGVPIGGSKAVIDDIVERFRDLGGTLRCESRVEELIIENDRAVGVVLKGGEELRADTVIWAADGYHLIFELLRGKYMNSRIRSIYEQWIPVRSMIHVCLGLARDLSNEPSRLIFELDKPIVIAGERHRWLHTLHHCFDPTMAAEGKSAVEVWFPTRYEYWEDLATRKGDYTVEKKRIADESIAALDDRWPGFADDVEVVDVPTPITYTRYTGNWKGSPDGWYVTPENLQARPLRTLPGLSDLMMVGQWTAPFTGTPIGALTGRQAIQILCHRDGVPWRPTLPT